MPEWAVAAVSGLSVIGTSEAVPGDRGADSMPSALEIGDDVWHRQAERAFG
jgi:hypothetical protein